jgi:hypothetical protein
VIQSQIRIAALLLPAGSTRQGSVSSPCLTRQIMEDVSVSMSLLCRVPDDISLVPGMLREDVEALRCWDP